MTAIAMGDFAAMIAASSRVNASSSAEPTKWLTSRHSLAFWVSRGAAVKNISLMTSIPAAARSTTAHVLGSQALERSDHAVGHPVPQQRRFFLEDMRAR
jgi:hypothetical protein